jgi:hypothetical protein
MILRDDGSQQVGEWRKGKQAASGGNPSAIAFTRVSSTVRLRQRVCARAHQKSHATMAQVVTPESGPEGFEKDHEAFDRRRFVGEGCVQTDAGGSACTAEDLKLIVVQMACAESSVWQREPLRA